MIDMIKTYRTRDGHEVRIYATDGGGEYPVHGATKFDGEWFMCNWSAKGAVYEDHKNSPGNLIEVGQQ